MNYRKKIREYIQCPQFGYQKYGKWGALSFEQRNMIKRLLDELDSADELITKNILNKEKITNKYKEKIKKLYKYKDDNETAHCERDTIYTELLEELGYKELADLLEKAEEDIGFWYS